MEFVCPRCRSDVGERLYGPCTACRDQLRLLLRRDAAAVDVAEYEPKMHVTPNAVALKE